jgi:hypothetical protein
MVGGVDFLLYCAGCGIVLVSSGAAIRLIKGSVSKAPSKAPLPAPAPKWEPVPEPSSEGLADRLTAFQSARFATPIVRPRALEYAPTPGEPGSPRVVPPIRGIRTRAYSTPRQPTPPKKPAAPANDSNVVPLPMKMKPEPSKED